MLVDCHNLWTLRNDERLHGKEKTQQSTCRLAQLEQDLLPRIGIYSAPPLQSYSHYHQEKSQNGLLHDDPSFYRAEETPAAAAQALFNCSLPTSIHSDISLHSRYVVPAAVNRTQATTPQLAKPLL
jgi:hypothetical protein